jgi:hypothetical protein
MPRKKDLGRLLQPEATAEMEASTRAQISDAPQRVERAKRLQPLPGAYVQVPMQWLLSPIKEHVFEPEARLFLLVLYRSHYLTGATRRQADRRGCGGGRSGWRDKTPSPQTVGAQRVGSGRTP